MAAAFPTKEQAKKIWEEGILYRLSQPYPYDLENEYRFHTLGVASAAEKIAAFIPDLDSEKAYVFGLLHDYGKRISEKRENKFHGREGYEQMILMGYPEIAQICLTHTFPRKNFNREQFSFPEEWIAWAREHLAAAEYTDYDYLVAFCDKLFEACSIVSIEKRVDAIVERYKLSNHQRELLYRESIGLKEYFDSKTGRDVYQILGIKD